ncbi:MAG: FtsH protease activity modulator HflK, partial [Pseudomonadota bacterium]
INPGPPAQYKEVPAESLMLTGDENIVDIKFIVQYRIREAKAYLFNVLDPENMIRAASEASIREISGKNMIDEVLTTGKDKIQEDTRLLLQQILDSYDSGLAVEAVQLQDVHPPSQVIAAFKDVASAREDKVKYINEAEGYSNDVLPKAKGKASQITNEAAAYRATKVKHSRGDTARFLSMLTEYSKAKDVTVKRLYLDTMEKIVSKANKVVLEEGISKNLLPVFPMNLNKIVSLPDEKNEEDKKTIQYRGENLK